MLPKISEAELEKLALDLLEQQGYTPLSSKELETERERTSDVILHKRLEKAVAKLNPNLAKNTIRQALQVLTSLTAGNLFESNETFYTMLIEGIKEEHQKDGETAGASVRLIDFENPLNNDFVVCGQFTVVENNKSRRLDIVLFINGLPLVVVELKSPGSESATVEEAYDQLQTYKNEIPSLFCYNGILVASDGYWARTGSLTSGWNRFMEWKTIDGIKETSKSTLQLETLIKGMLRPDVLLDLVRHFTIFERTTTKNEISGQTQIGHEKKIAAYHQYHAVKKAVESTVQATSDTGDKKVGVIWHTQGSGKSLSMVFYAGLLAINAEMKNPTIVVVTDRNDLDDQLFDAFAHGENLLRQTPKQASNRDEIKELLKTAGGGVVFSTIQKFSPEKGEESLEELSARKNIVVIADEAHRSQYGFGAKTRIDETDKKAHTGYGFAKYLRDALPNASFIGFTGTPLEKDDISTKAVFGDYIDIYDMEQAVEDGATVPIYYEQRLVHVRLKDEEKESLDEEVETITESQESTASEKVRARWTRMEAIIGQKERVKAVVSDILEHFEARQPLNDGKALIVATSRRIAVDMYDEIVTLRPDWYDQNNNQNIVKVVMTSSSSDPIGWQAHSTTKSDRRELKSKFRDTNSQLKIVIVCDMWLTGFDAPCLDTIYFDRMLSGHNLMQAIARVNRVHRAKPAGLVVDYIGIASNLKQALSNYTRNTGRKTPSYEKEKIIEEMLEKCDVIDGIFHGFDYERYFTADTGPKLDIILEAQEHLLDPPDRKKRFLEQIILLSKAFALSVPHPKALEIRDAVGFFQAVRVCLTKFERSGNKTNDAEMEIAIRQLVDEAVAVDGVVIDIYDAAGIKKPDLSILSDEFLAEIQGMEHKNLALELLKKLLTDEIRSRAGKNLVQSKKFSEMLEEAIRKYNNNMLTSVEILEELLKIAKEMRAADETAEEMGLSEDEVAFYDALILNDSAKEILGDAALRDLAQILVENVRKSTSIDWIIKESARAKVRIAVKRLLKKHGYPPDERKIATERIIQQAELKAPEWAFS